MEMYKANDNRYADMAYRRCGRSGLLLPVISLGLWHNFGSVDVFSNFIQIAYAAFDNGIHILILPIITVLCMDRQRKISAVS